MGIKYHLGCGGTYLPGYVNVDFPQSEHTIQQSLMADIYTDIIAMDYQPCEEIRSRHFFEHFNYMDSMVLLFRWTKALINGGHLLIDLPDIDALCKAMLTGSIEKKFRTIRYMYGSHEAKWAYHINGWSTDTLEFVLRNMGYSIVDIRKYGDPNNEFPNCGVEIRAVLQQKMTDDQLKQIIKNILSLYRNGDNETENNLWNIFYSNFLTKA
jgi:predicted SAM-dependent methyltransferase